MIAVDEASDLSKDKFSGIIGLSPFQADASNMPAFINQGEQVFSFFLSKQDGSTNGKIVLGGWDTSQYAKEGLKDSDIQWANLVDDSWTIPLEGLKFKDG